MRFLLAAVIVLLLPALPPGVSAQSELPAIWRGVFTAEQADRGKAVIAAHCARCHGGDRALSGDIFMLHWEGKTAGRLLRKMKETMPPAQVSAVSDREKLDALAFILQLNGLPAGEGELKDDPALLESLNIVPHDGPRPMRTGMVAEVVGCVTKGPDASWLLTNATEPAPTALDSSESDRQRAAETPLGGQTFRLLYLSPSPEAHIGKKAVVQGLLIRNPSGDGLNVITLTPLGTDCGK